MKKLLYLSFVFVFAFSLLSACNQSPAEGTEETQENEETTGFTGFLGPWTRTATYLNGELQGTTPASLNFYPDLTYDSATDACATSGTYEEIGEGTVTMVMMQNGCPGNIALPFTITYTYTLSEDEDGVQTMTMVTGPITETYVR